MPYAEIMYRPGKSQSRKRGFRPHVPIRSVAVYARPGEKLSTVLARFLGVRENELRRELRRLADAGLICPSDNPRDVRLTRWLRVEGSRGTRRAYILHGDLQWWLDRQQGYRPPLSHERRAGNPRLGRLLSPVRFS
jgi:hypothetical protein